MTQPQEQEPRRWAIGPGPPGSEGTTELVVRGGPWTEEVEVVEASAYERAEAELERLRGAIREAEDVLFSIAESDFRPEPVHLQAIQDRARDAQKKLRSALNPPPSQPPEDEA